MFFPQLENSEETQKKPRKNSSIKKFIRTHKVQFWRTCQKFLPNTKHLLPQLPLEDMNFFRGKKQLYSNLFSYSTYFDKSPQNFWSELEKVVNVFSSKIKFSTKFFCPHELHFDTPFETFAPKCQNFFLTARRRWKKIIIFRRKNSPIKNLRWTQRMQFWKTHRKSFAESGKICDRRKKNEETIQRIYFQK